MFNRLETQGVVAVFPHPLWREAWFFRHAAWSASWSPPWALRLSFKSLVYLSRLFQLVSGHLKLTLLHTSYIGDNHIRQICYLKLNTQANDKASCQARSRWSEYLDHSTYNAISFLLRNFYIPSAQCCPRVQLHLSAQVGDRSYVPTHIQSKLEDWSTLNGTSGRLISSSPLSPPTYHYIHLIILHKLVRLHLICLLFKMPNYFGFITSLICIIISIKYIVSESS